MDREEPRIISKRSTRSLVWNHFSRSLETAKCNYCKRDFKMVNASTTNLRDHLMRHHKEYVTGVTLDKTIIELQPVFKKEAQFHIGTSSVKRHHQKARRSSIWNHFVRDEERQVAICNNCKKEYKICGNTSNFLRHFICCHKKKSKDVEQHQKITRSPVWNHFKKSSIPQFVTCKHCKKEFKTCGNTSNLINHLRRQHKEITVNSNNLTFEVAKEEANDEESESSSTNFTDFIWLHFKKDMDTAVCNYCSKKIKTYGNTSSLRHHLKTYHEEKLMQYQDNVLTFDMKSEVDHFMFLDDVPCEEETEATLDIDNFLILENGSYKAVNESENMDTFESLENSFAAKQPYKSFVWKHFVKNKDRNTAMCIHCNEERKTSGNTSNLKLHLLRYHRDLVIDDDDNPIFPEESSISFENRQPNERCWSFVWNHFTKSDIKHRAICNYCLKDCNTTNGNTTSLKFHLERYHPEKLDKERDRVKITSPVKKKSKQKRVSSFVWRHFDKSQTPQKAVCLYCKQEYSTSGNTTNLKDHLMRYHKEELMCDEFQGSINAMPDEGTDELINDSHMISDDEAEAGDDQTINKPSVPEGIAYQQIFPQDWCRDEENAEQREENDFSEPENGLDEGKPKRRTRSFVWRHFKKSPDLNKVICLHCAKEFNHAHGSTSNLRVHLIRSHREELMFDEIHYTSLQHAVHKRRKSIVWDHFRKSTDRYRAICNYCQKECRTYGNTTNIKVHLMRYHRDMLGYDDQKNPLDADDEASDQQAEPKEAHPSFVWKHFRRSSTQWLAICNHCNKLCKTYGGTSHLRGHLMKYHGIKNDNIENIEQNEDSKGNSNLDKKSKNDLTEFLALFSQKSAKRPCRSFVWNHFTKSPIPWFSICNYCNKLCKTCGNTSSMKNHLMRHHKKEISEDAEIEDVEPNEDSDEEINDDIFIVPEQNMTVSDQKINDNIEEDIVVARRDSASRERSNKSLVWEHFTKSPVENKAICNHCKKECNTYGNTTNMKVHLMRYHKDITTSDKESKKRDKYYIWNHFKKTDVRHRAACNYCKKEYNTCGNSGRLKAHLIKHHSDVVDYSNSDKDQADAPEDGFDDTDSEMSSSDSELDEPKDGQAPQYATCNNCKRLCPIASLKKHLMTCRKEEKLEHDTHEGRKGQGKYVKEGVTIKYEGENCKIADNLGNEFVILVVA